MKLSEKIDQAHVDAERILNILSLLIEQSKDFEFLPTLCTLQTMACGIVEVLDEE